MAKSSNASVAIVREYARSIGVPNHYVYNDPLVNGGRSIKVWGWKFEDYANAREALRKSGLVGKIVRNPNTWGTAPYRIWVD
jgi:hypothetical protein